MNKRIWIGIFWAVVVGLGIYIFSKGQNNPASQTNTPVVFDPLNATYTIDEQPVKLTEGKSEVEAEPGSAIKIITAIFGEPVIGDLNGDGKDDAAMFIVENPGGTGTFYYAAAALNTPAGAQGTNAIFLGDRIAPQNIEIKDGQIIANYADRKQDEPMAESPSVGVSKYMIVDKTILKTSTGPREITK